MDEQAAHTGYILPPSQGPRPVKALNAHVARKIAAGEVIDRPNAVLREFLDNAIDAGSTRIVAEITNGGIASIRVVDNGWGMTKADLEACARPHVTGKISDENDLENLFTLGFRGEALASIAAVSRLEITSCRNNEAWKMEAVIEGEHSVTPAVLHEGSIIVSQGLFENFPARRKFLKRAQSESSLCKQTFIEKALPFTDIAFRLVIDNKIRFDFAAKQSLCERFTEALDMPEKVALFYEVSSSDSAWNTKVLLAEPSVHRNDRKHMYIFVNGRRVQEYALLQAIDYGAQGYFPNGTHPVACLFVTIDPQLVDFNIHPAKKEVRFKDISSVHRAVSSLVRNFYRDFSIKNLTNENLSQNTFLPMHSSFAYQKINQNDDFKESAERENAYRAEKHNKPPAFTGSPTQTRSSTTDAMLRSFSVPPQSYKPEIAHNNFSDFKHTETIQKSFRFIGTVLDVFLLVEKDDELYFVDQHAGHERILYERFMKTAGQKQMLLIPLVIETAHDDEDAYLNDITRALEEAGFLLKNCGEGRWEVSAVPIKWQGTERDLQNDLLEKRLKPEEIIRSLAETTACRAAVKDGHVLDFKTAEKLVEDIFSLEDPHCPHGRPLWKKITKEELYKAVRRL